MSRPVDHVIWAAPDLDAAIDQLEALCGVRAELGGVHPGRGTRNALIALGPACYLEILAPDPTQTLDGTFGSGLLELRAPQIFGVMLASRDLEEAKAVFAEYGVDCTGPFDATRKTPGGAILRWRLLIPVDPGWGDCTPMMIDWGQSPSPAAAAPRGCRLVHYEVGHPDGERLNQLCARLEAGIHVARSDRPYSMAILEGPGGRSVLTGFREA